MQQIVVVHDRELILVHVVLLTKARVEYTLIRRYNYSGRTDEWKAHNCSSKGLILVHVE